MFIKRKNKMCCYIMLFFFAFCANAWTQTRTVDNAKFITQSIPGRMSPEQTYNLIVTFENIGTTTWYPGGYKLRISSGANSSYSVWSVSDLDIVKRIDPGTSVSFEVKVTAPSTEGVYPFTAQLVHGDYIFGETNKTVDISVSREVSYNDALNSSAFVEQTIPTLMTAGKPYKITVSMTNTGKTTWMSHTYRLVMLDASGKAFTGSNWSTYSAEINENVAPGGTKVFSFEIIPLLPGAYTLQWRMASSETGLFGDATKAVVVRVEMAPKKKSEGKRGKE